MKYVFIIFCCIFGAMRQYLFHSVFFFTSWFSICIAALFGIFWVIWVLKSCICEVLIAFVSTALQLKFIKMKTVIFIRWNSADTHTRASLTLVIVWSHSLVTDESWPYFFWRLSTILTSKLLNAFSFCWAEKAGWLAKGTFLVHNWNLS